MDNAIVDPQVWGHPLSGPGNKFGDIHYLAVDAAVSGKTKIVVDDASTCNRLLCVKIKGLFTHSNYIEILNHNNAISFVSFGTLGVWRNSLAKDNSGPHEFGHILGLDDRYSKKGPNSGWKGNVMAMPAGKGAADQRNIDPVAKYVLERHLEFMKRINEVFTPSGTSAKNKIRRGKYLVSRPVPDW